MEEKKRKLNQPKLTPEGYFTLVITLLSNSLMGKDEIVPDLMHIYLTELVDSPTFKGFVASMDDILENLGDVDFTARGNNMFTLFS